MASGQGYKNVAFESQGGSAVTTRIAANNNTVSQPAAPRRAGFSFEGWYKEPECTNAWNFGSDLVTTDRTLYAKWTAQSPVTVTFNTQGGGEISPQSVAYDDYVIKPSDPQRLLYAFEGWYKEAECINAWNFASDTVKSNTTLYAKWHSVLVPVGISCAKTDAALYGASNGSITLTATGGNTGTYGYSIDNGTTWQSSGYYGNVSAGTYNVKVCDAGNQSNSASAEITISQPPLKGTYKANKLPSQVVAGGAIIITPPSPPKGYTLIDVSYSSSNRLVAMIDAGNVTFLKGGKVKITVNMVFRKTDARGKVTTKKTKISKQITVIEKVSAINLNVTNAPLALKKSLKLKATVVPGSATNKKVKWKTSNKKIATVSGSGVVNAKGKGTCTITCTAQDKSGVSASCTITVY